MKSVEERIIETANRLFYLQGYNKTGINQLIEEAGIAKASLYSNYSSKQEVALAYLHSKSDSWVQRLRGQLSPGATPKRKVELIYDFLESLIEEKTFVGCAFQKMSSEIDPQTDPEIEKEIKRIKQMLRNFFHALVAKNAEKPLKSEQALGDELFMLFEGAMISFQVHRELWPVLAARSASLKLLKK